MILHQYKLGVIPISPDILNKANIGLWAFELDEGEAPRMYVDDVMLGLIGLTHQVSPEETYHAWYDNIDEGSYGLVADAVNKMMAGEHAEVQYPWHHPDGRIMVVRCGGVRNPEYKRGARIEGVHQNVTEVIHFDEKVASENKQMLDSFAGRFNTVLMLDEDDTFSIVKHKPDSKYEIPEADRFSESVRAFANNYVYEPDREVLMEANDASKIIERAKMEKSFSVEFRIIDIETGHRLWCEEIVRYLSDSKAVVAIRLHDKEILQKLVDEKLYKEYASVFLVDLKADYFRFLYRNPESGFSDIPGGIFSETIQEYTARVHPDYKDGFSGFCDADKIREVLSKESRIEYCYPLEGAEKKWRRCVIQLLDSENGVPSTFVMTYMTIDDTQAAHLELSAQVAKQKEQLEVQSEKLKEALEAAESANLAKTVFLNNMSHDMRTPLNAIIGFNNIALKEIGHDDAKVRDSLEKVGRSSEMLLDLINNVLEISRIEAGKVSLVEEQGNIMYTFSEVDTVMYELARNAGVELTFNVGDIRNKYVRYDSKQLGRVLSNLISNAVKYTQRGGWVKVCCEQLGCENEGIGLYKYTVEDNGIGISEEFQKNLFDRFAREKSTTVSGIQGTGLGLAMCKELVELMGGTISCESEKGKGSKFTVILPFKVQKGKNFRLPDTQSDQESIDFRGRRLLLVEDNELNREISTVILEEFGFKVVTASDGDIAVDIMTSAKAGDYDAVIMDVQMPRMDGYTATRMIRALGTEISKIPIIAMTANAFAEDRQAAIDAGMDDHLAKPVDINRLKDILSRLL